MWRRTLETPDRDLLTEERYYRSESNWRDIRERERERETRERERETSKILKKKIR